MEVDTIFDMASLTKIMPTAVAIMILVEEGRLALSDPVSKHLNRFSQYGKHRVTVRQLLTHYSGLRPSLSLKTNWRGYETAVARACREQLAARPGARFRYSDINYVVLGELVRAISGDHLDAFSRKRVFEPLGMKDTSFNPRERMKPRIAPTERHEGKMLHGRVHDPTAARMGGCAGHAGVFSTADDVARYGQMILNGGVYDGRRILSPLAVLQMTTPQSPAGKAVLRGLGFDIHSRYHAPRGDLFPVGLLRPQRLHGNLPLDRPLHGDAGGDPDQPAPSRGPRRRRAFPQAGGFHRGRLDCRPGPDSIHPIGPLERAGHVRSRQPNSLKPRGIRTSIKVVRSDPTASSRTGSNSARESTRAPATPNPSASFTKSGLARSVPRYLPP